MIFVPIGDDIRTTSFPILPLVLITINSFVFMHQFRMMLHHEGNVKALHRDIEDHYNTWGLVPNELTENGKVIGLLTHMFMHGGLMHLVGNMIVLWAFACSLEIGFGSMTLLGFYILWGLVGGLSHVAMDWNGEVPLVGASGAIAGLIGAYTILYGYKARIRCFLWICYYTKVIRVPAAVFGGLWIIMQLHHASADPEGAGGVAWFAHIGGFFAGAVTALIFRGDMESKLCQDKDGKVAFEESEERKKIRAEKLARAATEAAARRGIPIPEPVAADQCPYCRTPLADAVRLGETLLRCGNEACEHLIYEENVVPSL